ncbi:MAG TPA: phosphate signaling complex protein PhoU [Lachnospiraceae bacterium]|jgi:phosphate transport system protein|nr:phosphate signaling complex protein PhoU [Lachnospiraceae bacterium]
MTARMNFEMELELLHDRVAQMGRYVEQKIDSLFFALENEDKELATSIMSGDRVIDDMEKEIEAKCLSLITRQQPVARDLRVVSATLKVVTDIERIGDHAADIAELAVRNQGISIYHISKPMPELITAAKDMVHDAVDAFIQNDRSSAAKIIETDDIVDDLFNQAKDEVVRMLRGETVTGTKITADEAERRTDPDCLVDVLMIAKYLEKIGDHAVNICEWAIFRETGSIDSVRLL